jgi:hypothetical protein
MADPINPFASMNPPQGWPAGASWPPRMSPAGEILQPSGWPASMDWNRMQNQLAALQAQQPIPASQYNQPHPASQTQPSAPVAGNAQPAGPTMGPQLAAPGGYELPPELTSSSAFQGSNSAYLGSGWKIKGARAATDANGVSNGWVVEYLGPDNQSTLSVSYAPIGDSIQMTGSTGNLQTQTAAEAAQKAAQTNLLNVQARHESGQATQQELENAQIQANLAAGKGSNTDAQIAQIEASHAGSAATIGNTQAAQANVDLAYVQAVAQVLEKQGYAANQAYQMALDYATKKATVDQANTNTVVNAATSLLNNDTVNRNARLNAATSGFSQDVQQALALNDTMPIGSGDAAKVLAALTGLRHATAGKWGAFDEKVPPVLQQLGYNTPIGMASLDYDDVMNHANALQDRAGTAPGMWPTIPGAPFGGKYVSAPGDYKSAQQPGQTGQAASAPYKPIVWDSGTKPAARWGPRPRWGPTPPSRRPSSPAAARPSRRWGRTGWSGSPTRPRPAGAAWSATATCRPSPPTSTSTRCPEPTTRASRSPAASSPGPRSRPTRTPTWWPCPTAASRRTCCGTSGGARTRTGSTS